MQSAPVAKANPATQPETRVMFFKKPLLALTLRQHTGLTPPLQPRAEQCGGFCGSRSWAAPLFVAISNPKPHQHHKVAGASLIQNIAAQPCCDMMRTGYVRWFAVQSPHHCKAAAAAIRPEREG